MANFPYIGDLVNKQPPKRFAYWVKESGYQLTEEQIQQEIILQVQPGQVVGTDRVSTITFPDQETFTRHYYIPGVNDTDAGVKPHIESFRFSVWLYYFTSNTSPVKLILNSTGNWLPFVSNERLDETDGVYIYKYNIRSESPELHTFAFMRPTNYSSSVGVEGWSFHTIHANDWIPIASPPPTELGEDHPQYNALYEGIAFGKLYVKDMRAG